MPGIDYFRSVVMEKDFEGLYPHPVNQLISLGDVRGKRGWIDYRSLGITSDHVPDLIKMLHDQELRWADSDTLEVWSPVHAWRALGQLESVEAIDTLIGLFHEIDDHDDDWVGEEIPQVLGMIGPDAIPPLIAHLADRKHGLWAKVAASVSLEEIGKRHSESREACVAGLQTGLQDYKKNDETLNAFFISSLVGLKDVEAAPLVERAYLADKVDISVMGDFEDYQIEVGLLEKRLTPPRFYFWTKEDPLAQWEADKKTQREADRRKRQQAKKEKTKRKAAKKIRRGKRKKKKR
jgi:hypothetical protein